MTELDDKTQESQVLLDRTRCDVLVESLSDKPRWLMARGLCLAGRSQVVVGPEGQRQAGYFVVDSLRPTKCQAVRRPVAALVEELFEHFSSLNEILAHGDATEHLRSLLPGWTTRPTTVHISPNPDELPPPAHEVRHLTSADAGLLAAFPPALAHELKLAIDHVPTVATIVDGKPVAFCYAKYETESWWDISVDTLESHRRQGYASSAAAFLIREMLARGKRPVWGALDANEGSLRLAAKYGFRAIDRMIVFTRDDA